MWFFNCHRSFDDVWPFRRTIGRGGGRSDGASDGRMDRRTGGRTDGRSDMVSELFLFLCVSEKLHFGHVAPTHPPHPLVASIYTGADFPSPTVTVITVTICLNCFYLRSAPLVALIELGRIQISWKASVLYLFVLKGRLFNLFMLCLF